MLSWVWWRPSPARDDALALAGRLSGTSHFRVELRDERVGRLDTESRVEATAVRFRTHLTTALPGASPADVEETFVFSTTAPYALARAERIERQGGQERRVTIVPGPTGYIARIGSHGEERIKSLEWTYDLGRHLALEHWLDAQAPSVGATFASEPLDLARLAPVQTRYVVTHRTRDGGWLVRGAADGDGQLLDIGSDLLPRALASADSLLLVHVQDDTAPLLRTRTLAPDTRVPLPTKIPNPTRVTRLVLAADPYARAVLGAGRQDGAIVVDARVRLPVLDEERAAALVETVDLPISSPEVQRVLARVPRAPNTETQVDRVLETVRKTLVYDDTGRSLDLAGALRAGRGDCTEFADLFTTLARALDIPARPVNGLVYAEIDGPGFYVHAWSEVALDGHWVSVDPTSGLRPADATHVPFPGGPTGFLRAYAALDEMRLTVVDVEHDGAG